MALVFDFGRVLADPRDNNGVGEERDMEQHASKAVSGTFCEVVTGLS